MMKRSMILGTVLVFAAVAAVVFAAPVGGAIWGTVGVRGQILTTTADLLASSDADTAPGLAVALRVHLNKTASDIQSLGSVDVTTMSDEDLNAYAAALTSLNQAIAYAGQTASSFGYSDLAAQADAAVASLTAIVQQQVYADGRLYTYIIAAPTGGTVWGTVSAKPPQQL